MDNIQNPGSALGEAIGAQMELALNEYLAEVVGKYSCRLISKGQQNPKTKKTTKLLLYDGFGTVYNIDAVVANESMQPLILIEYKYIRYKKHNRDKAVGFAPRIMPSGEGIILSEVPLRFLQVVGVAVLLQ